MTHVDGYDVQSLTVEGLRPLVLGEPGSPVELSFERQGRFVVQALFKSDGTSDCARSLVGPPKCFSTRVVRGA